MEIITFSRAAAHGQHRLELQGQRLLVGDSDTGIFKIAVLKAPRRDTVPAAGSRRRRDDDDGLASATIAIRAALAIEDDEPASDPRNWCGGPRPKWRRG
jgi:hypothetical protein